MGASAENETRPRGALVTEENVDTLTEAYTAVAIVTWAGRTAIAAAEILSESRWPDGRNLRVPTIGAREDPDEGHVVMLEGLALNEGTALAVAGIALKRVTRRLVEDPYVPGELTGALLAVLAEVDGLARQRTLRLASEKLGLGTTT